MRSDTSRYGGGSGYRGSNRVSGTDVYSTPIGVGIVVFLGLVGSLLEGIVGVTLLPVGSLGLVAGTVMIAIALAKGYVLLNLYAMEPWAYNWALGLYGFSAFLDLYRADILGAILSVVVVVYLLTKADLY